MDFITQKLLHIRNKIRDEFASLKSSIHNIEKHIGTVAENTKTNQERDSPPQIVPVNVHVQPANEPNKEPREKRREGREIWESRRDWVRLVLEFMGVVGALLVLIVATNQWKQMKRANRIAQESVELTRKQYFQSIRPRVWLTPNGWGEPNFFPNPKTSPLTGQIIWTYHFSST